MFDVSPYELLLVAIVALVVIGPKDLPKAMRFVGQWVSKARGVMSQFRAGFDTMVREAELKEMEERWAAENARIMREYPPTSAEPPSASAERMLAGSGEDNDNRADDVPAVMTEMPVVTSPPPPLTDDEIAAAEGMPSLGHMPPGAAA